MRKMVTKNGCSPSAASSSVATCIYFRAAENIVYE
jgi:hypothetical protein